METEKENFIDAAFALYEVLAELEESSGYWSEYDVPLGIVERISKALQGFNDAVAQIVK